MPPSPSMEWKEVVAGDEEERFGRYAEALRALQSKAAAGGSVARALHAKAHAGVRAELEVLGDAPEPARQGIFARPAKYEGYARFSNGSRMRQHDRKGDVRGLAIKLLGVRGKKALGDDSVATQDFLGVQSSTTPFRTPDEFVAFVRSAATPATLVPRLFFAIGIGRTLTILKRLAGGNVPKPVATLAGMQFFSAAPIRIGPYAARYSFEPLQATDVPVPADPSGGYLSDDLATRLRAGPLAWNMKLQFFENEDRTPIEDGSTDWDAPYLTVARLTLPQQDVASADGKKISDLVETLSFDPWHALEDHRPLGAMMRARKVGYFASTQARGAAPEPP